MDHLIRQFDLIPENKLSQRITIIGAGAIGSHTSIALAKMGFINQLVYDFDEVSIENMNCQGYRFKDIGKSKVQCLAEIVKEYSGADIETKHEMFDSQPLDGIVISAVDSMKVRQTIWNACKNNIMVDYLIDPRMSIEYALKYVIKPTIPMDIEDYEKTLYSDENSVQERCTMKSVMYTANLISGLVARDVKNLVCKDNYDRVVTYDIETNSMMRWKNDSGLAASNQNA